MAERRQIRKACKLIGIVFLIHSVTYLAQYAYCLYHAFQFVPERPNISVESPSFMPFFGVPAGLYAACFVVFFFGASVIAAMTTRKEES